MKKFIISIFLILSIVCLCSCKFTNNISVINNDGIYIINLPKNTLLEPFVADNVSTNKKVFDDNNFLLSMNAGYFDTVNKQTTSYVVINQQEILNPNDNKNLINNQNLQKGINKILNRSELRYLNCNNDYKYVIQKHFEPVKSGCILINSIQAGPQLLPQITSEEEYFISKDKNGKIIRNSISTNSKVARIAIGILPDNSLAIFIATNKHPMTLNELSKYMKSKNIESAINFDGGGSVSLNYKNIDIFSDKNNTRRSVKSFLVIK